MAALREVDVRRGGAGAWPRGGKREEGAEKWPGVD